MNREIKFRAWNNGQMWEIFDLLNPKEPIDNWPKGNILMQFTGLKDKNGKEIYEGDVVYRREEHNQKRTTVRAPFNIREFYGVVEYHADGGIAGDDEAYDIPGFYLRSIRGHFKPKHDVSVKASLNETVVPAIEPVVQNDEYLNSFKTYGPNDDWNTTLEVIGNVFENPELLK